MQYRSKIPIAIERYLLDVTILALLVVLYAPLLIHWFDGWLSKDISVEQTYFSHGLIGLPFAAYIVWTNRQRWGQLPNTTHPLSIVLLVLGGVFYLSGQSELVNLSFPIVLVGISLWLKGVPGLKLQGFPLLLVALATPNPIPYLIAPFAMPLQQFIAGTAGFILLQLGFNVTVEQIYVSVGGRVVEIGAYCSGLKLLFNTFYLGLVLLYWSGAWNSRKTTMLFLLGTGILGIIASIVRNTLLVGLHVTGHDSAFEWLHQGSGGHVYSACCMVLLVPLLNAIERFFPENG